ncbi:MAG: DNA repair protein RadA [Treponema sp.]|nr:MAG: DNA repair protein RadA [Treponema sp.]
MAKRLTIFKCSDCGHSQPKWLGRCPACGLWNTFEEVPATDLNSKAGAFQKKQATNVSTVPLSAVKPQDSQRLSTGIDEFDRVLGAGAVKRSAIIIGGEPGIGKSTLLLQVAAGCKRKVLYVSGEESAGQIRSRADRLGIPLDNIELLCTSSVSNIEKVLNSLNPIFVIIDSIQTLYSPDAGAVPGTINQLKYCSYELISWVKERDSVLFLTAHVTKEGIIAGPKAMEHLVDAVISFERNQDDIRFLRASKNRFGSVDELGIFEMSETGLSAVQDPSTLFITSRLDTLPAGSTIVPVFEGSRVFIVEIQALTVPAKSSISRVFSDKIESQRVSRIAAVIEKRIGLCFSDQDIYVNVAGGIKLREPAIDLALALALYSARTDLLPKNKSVYVGELSLAGEIRPVKKLAPRLKTAASLGFTSAYTPPVRANEPEQSTSIARGIVKTLKEAIKEAFQNTVG